MTDKNNPKDLCATALKDLFKGAGDFNVRKIMVQSHILHLFFIDGLTASDTISDFIIQPMEMLLEGSTPQQLLSNAELGQVFNAVAVVVKDIDDAAMKLVNGFTMVCFEGLSQGLAFETKSGVSRGTSPPQVENTIKGAKDAFVENMRINTALLRQHLRTPALRLTQSVVGKRSHTNVTVAWIEGLTNITLVDKTLARLDEIDIDGFVTPCAIEEYITGSRKTPFPLLQYTERTDRFAGALLEGRIGIFVDGIPLGYMAPVTLGRVMTSPEDLTRDYLTSSCLRVLRYLALFISLVLPAFYVAVAAFHAEMLPTKLLLAMIESKQSVPFPTILEVVFLLLAFEILQESGLQLPKSVGQSVSIIGGLVVGTAAVEANLVSPAALIAVAIGGICGYIIPQQDFADGIRVWRFALTIFASIMGLFGLAAGLLVFVGHLASLNSYGSAYLSPFSDVSSGDAVLRRRLVTEKMRDKGLDPLDQRNQR